jgi:hypothetical protein
MQEAVNCSLTFVTKCSVVESIRSSPPHQHTIGARNKSLIALAPKLLSIHSITRATSPNQCEFQNQSLRVIQLNSGAPNFAEFSAIWFSEAGVSWRNSHNENVAFTLRKYPCPASGDMPLDQITKAQLLAFRANLTKLPHKNVSTGLSPARINKIMMPLRQVLNEGTERYQYQSPFRALRLSKFRNPI